MLGIFERCAAYVIAALLFAFVRGSNIKCIDACLLNDDDGQRFESGICVIPKSKYISLMKFLVSGFR